MNPERSNLDGDRRARLADVVLGQLDDSERAEVLLELASHSESRELHGELERLVGALRASREEEDLPDPSAALRELVEQKLTGSVVRKHGWRRGVLTAAILALAGCLILAALQWQEVGKRQHRQMAAANDMASKNEMLLYQPTPLSTEEEVAVPALGKSGEAQDGTLMLLHEQLLDELAGTKPLPTQANAVAVDPEGAEVKFAGSKSIRGGRTEEIVDGSQLFDSSPRIQTRRADLLEQTSGAARGRGDREAKVTEMRASELSTSRERLSVHSPTTTTAPQQTTHDYYYSPVRDAAVETAEDRSRRKRFSGRKDGRVAARPFRVTVKMNEEYLPITENSFLRVNTHPLSTFGIDVDSAAYANVRRFLTSGSLPPPNAVRIEELVNYFQYDGARPRGNDPFGVDFEVSSCPWRPENRLLRIQLKGKEVHRDERPASNLVFLLDVSGSMSDANKLPLLKQAMKLLADQLTESDRVAIVTYAGQAGLRLGSTRGDRKQEIRSVIDALKANGSTNGSAGIQLAYEQASRNLIAGGTNRVILATDGDLNVGVTANDELVQLIQKKAESGVFLTVLGLGEGNLKDGKLEQLANNGNGVYAYLDSLREARKVLVEQMTGNLVTIAKDVKIKVEFNPAEVESYRLIGYENRLMEARDFDNDRRDSGDIGAGHTVTALYEVVPADNSLPTVAASRTLKYQRRPEPVEVARELTEAAGTGELLTLSLRYKEPEADESVLREFAVKQTSQSFVNASDDLRFAAAVASFGMLLRGSEHRGNATFASVEEIASGAIGSDPRGHRTEFLDLVRKAETADQR